MDRIKIKISDFEVIDHHDLWGNLKKSKFPDRYILSRVIVNEQADEKRPHRIKLMMYYDSVKDKFTIGFNGSIRKWYFGKNTRKDLSYLQFLECIKLLSSKIGIREQDLWNAKITQLESGITLLLNNKFKDLDKCFLRHRTFDKSYRGSTLYFKGKNYNLKIYDKYTEINKNDKSFYEDVIKMQVLNKFYFFRFEVNVRKVSGVPFYKKNASTLEDVKKNWNTIILQLQNYIDIVDFVDLISPEKKIDLSAFSKQFNKKYIQLKAIQKNGIEAEITNIQNRMGANKSRDIKLFLRDIRRYITKEIDLKSELLLELKKKTNRLYNNSNIESII